MSFSRFCKFTNQQCRSATAKLQLQFIDFYFIQMNCAFSDWVAFHVNSIAFLVPLSIGWMLLYHILIDLSIELIEEYLNGIILLFRVVAKFVFDINEIR